MGQAGNEPADAGTDHQHRARPFLFVIRTGLDKRLLYELLRKPSFYREEILYWAVCGL